jgi:hypothetical protein
MLLISTNCYALDFEWTDTRTNYESKITSYLTDTFNNLKKLKRALTALPFVLDECEKQNVNPSIVAAIIYYESSWNHKSIGKKGEIGLMQVNNFPIPKDNPKKQVEKGIELLKIGYTECNSIEGALSFYATGHTCKGYKGLKLRINLAKHIDNIKLEKPNENL